MGLRENEKDLGRGGEEESEVVGQEESGTVVVEVPMKAGGDGLTPDLEALNRQVYPPARERREYILTKRG